MFRVGGPVSVRNLLSGMYLINSNLTVVFFDTVRS
jgi:hypothetical protein